MLTYTGGEPHAPTADFELVHAAVHQAKHDGTKLRVGPCVSSSTFYDPDTGRAQRWSDRGVLAVEMEAAILFTIAALRRDPGGLPADGLRRHRGGRVRPHHATPSCRRPSSA